MFAPADLVLEGWWCGEDSLLPEDFRPLEGRFHSAGNHMQANTEIINKLENVNKHYNNFYTCGLVEVTLDVDRSMTVPPGDVGGPPFICDCDVVTHFTDRLIAENPAGIVTFVLSYW